MNLEFRVLQAYVWIMRQVQFVLFTTKSIARLRRNQRRLGTGELTAKSAKGAKEDTGGRVFNPPTPGLEKFARAAQIFMDSSTKDTKGSDY